MTLAEFLENLQTAQEARRAAMRKLHMAVEELAAADATLEQALSGRFDGGDSGIEGIIGDILGEVVPKVSKEIARVLPFGDLF